MNKNEPGQSSADKAGFYYGYVIVASALISMVSIYSIPLSYGIFFKPMASELGWNRTIVSGAYSLSRIAAGLVSIPAGWLIDKMGARLVLVISGILCGLGFFLISRIDAVWQLYIIYGVIIGAGTGIFAPMVSMVAKWFVKRRATMTGVVISGAGLATLIGPPITNLLISEYGWRPAYVIAGSVCAVIVIIAAQFMRRDPHQLGLPALGEEDSTEERIKVSEDSFSLSEAASTRQFWIFFSMSISYSFCFIIVLVHLAPYMTDLGISTTTAANVMATIGGMIVVGLVLMGNIGDRIGNMKTCVIGFTLMTLVMLLLLFIKEIWHFYLFAVIFGIAFAGISTQRPPIVARMFGVRSHGLIFSAIDNSYMIGAATGPLLAGYIFDISGNYLYAFLTSIAIAVAGLILLISLKPSLTRNKQ